jgi:hypothetical protein
MYDDGMLLNEADMFVKMSQMRKLCQLPLGALIGIFCLSCMWLLLWWSVRWLTTSYCLEWVGSDGRMWETAREVPLESGARLFVRFDYWSYTKKDRYAIRIEGNPGVELQGKLAKIEVRGRDCKPSTIHLALREYPINKNSYYALLPEEFLPRNENEILQIHFTVLTEEGRYTAKEDVTLEFKACLLRHYFDLSTDIT